MRAPRQHPFLSDPFFREFFNQGNSGGALVNTNGQLIGINSQILSPSGGNIVLASQFRRIMARNVIEQLIKTAKVRRGHLGVAIQPVTPDLAPSFGLKEARGMIVQSVAPNSSAARAGIRQGDVITQFNGRSVVDGNSLRNEVAGTPPGTEVNLTILRDRSEQQVQVTLGEYPIEG